MQTDLWSLLPFAHPLCFYLSFPYTRHNRIHPVFRQKSRESSLVTSWLDPIQQPELCVLLQTHILSGSRPLVYCPNTSLSHHQPSPEFLQWPPTRAPPSLWFPATYSPDSKQSVLLKWKSRDDVTISWHKSLPRSQNKVKAKPQLWKIALAILRDPSPCFSSPSSATTTTLLHTGFRKLLLVI